MHILEVKDDGDGVTSTIFVTRSEAEAIIAMKRGKNVRLSDGVIAEHHADGTIWFCGHGVRPSGRRSELLPRLLEIASGFADE